MTMKAEGPGTTLSEPQTPTLVESEQEQSPQDVEKQQESTDDGQPFPDGGLRAWATVVGAWLAGKSLSRGRHLTMS